MQLPVLFASKRFGDARGWFCETYSERSLARHGIHDRFVQDNQSLSAQTGTIRGLHYQLPPAAQAKLVRVVRGRIFDVAVDIRRASPTYGQFVSAELSADNGHQLYVPVGFAHGFCTLEDNTEVLYKVSDFYSPKHEAGIRWDDPLINIPWPVAGGSAVVSAKDVELPSLSQCRNTFIYAGAPLQPLTLMV